MFIGSIAGALLLKYVSGDMFSVILSVAFLIAGFWFLFIESKKSIENRNAPQIANSLDIAVGSFAGFLGGFIGINAPPLILHFSRYLNKRLLRRLLVLIFLPAAIAQTATFWASGLLSKHLLFYGFAMLPGLCVGIYLGNKVFIQISEAFFKKTLGVLLITVSLRTLYKYFL